MNHTSPIILQEFESCEVELPFASYSTLRKRYSGLIDVGPTELSGIYRVSARDYVGRVSLPGGTILSIRPKINTANLFYMLCADAGLARFKPPPTGLDSEASILDFVIAAFLQAVSSLLAGGLYRQYAQHLDDLPVVRGRIAMEEQVGRYGDLKHRHVCLYTDLSHDTPENRVVLATLRNVPALIDIGKPWGDVQARKARSMARHFEGVTPVGRHEALTLLDRSHSHRLNHAYGPALALSRLVLSHLTLDEESGPHPFLSFLVNMPRLFESFLTSRLRGLLQAYCFRVVAQHHDYLDEEKRVGIRPDVLVYARTGTEPLLVLDAKYRKLGAPGTDLSRDLYQVSAYLDRYKLGSGVLVYPRFNETGSMELRVRGTPKRLHLATLDLGADSPEVLEKDCERLASDILRIIADPHAKAV